MGRYGAQLYHVGWTYGSPAGTSRFVWTETETVSHDGNTYDGSGQDVYTTRMETKSGIRSRPTPMNASSAAVMKSAEPAST